MSSLIIGALAAVVAASVTLPLGLWLGSRRQRAEVQRFKTIADAHQSAMNQVAEQHEAVLGRIFNAALNVMRAERGRPS